MKLFLDTNAVIDLFSQSRGADHEAMRKIVSLCQGTNAVLAVSATTMKDLSYLIEHGAWFKQAVPSPSRRQAISIAAREFLLKRCELCVVDYAICAKAHLNPDEPDFDDAVITECAAACNADAIISRDKAAFLRSKVKKMTPAECAAALEASR